MKKIIAPNKNFTGVSAGVGFVNGIGTCDKADLISWFSQRGYEVTENIDVSEDIKVEELQKEIAEAKVSFVEFEKQYNALWKERDELKAENEKLKKELKKAGA